VIHLSGVVGEGTVSLTHDLLAESCKFHGAGTLVPRSDLPRSLLVNKGVVDHIGDASLAELASSEKRTVPTLLLLRELVLPIVVVGHPQIGYVAINSGSTVLGSL
jgi:hypothetical protein